VLKDRLKMTVLGRRNKCEILKTKFNFELLSESMMMREITLLQ